MRREWIGGLFMAMGINTGINASENVNVYKKISSKRIKGDHVMKRFLTVMFA